MKINTAKIKTALDVVKSGLAQKELIEQTTSFAFIKGHVITYNDEVSVSYPLPELKTLTGAIAAKEFYDLFQKIKTEEVEVEVTDTEMVVTMGRSKAGFVLQTEIKLPLSDMVVGKEWIPLYPDFVNLLDFASGFCGSDLSRPMLTCVHVRKDGVLEASDGYKAVQIKGTKIKIPSILLPSKACSYIVKLNPIEMAVGSGWVSFKNKEGVVIHCRIYEGKYVDIDSVVSKTGKPIALPKGLGVLLDRARVFAKRENFLDEGVLIHLGNKRFRIESENETGWIKEEVPVKYEGTPIKFALTPLLLQKVVGDYEVCLLTEDCSFIIFEGKNWKMVSLLRNV